MRRNVLSSITFGSVIALGVVACATAPVDDGFGSATQEQNPTQPAEEESPSAKLPPSSQGAGTSTDAGADAAKDAKDSGAPPADASTANPPSNPAPPPPPTTGGDCDPSDPVYFIKFATEANPTLCPCSASQCCYMGLGCVTK